MTIPLQGLNLKKHGSESGVTAPLARNLSFLGHRSVKTFLIFFHFLSNSRLARLSLGRLGGGEDGSLGAFGESMAPLASPWIRQCISPRDLRSKFDLDLSMFFSMYFSIPLDERNTMMFELFL